MTHTPTPWRVFTTTDGRKLVGIGDNNGQGILDCGFGVWSWKDAEGIANAELVVKAVNSHEPLMNLLETAGDLLRDSRSNHIAGSSSDEAWDKIRASLLKDIDALFSQERDHG